MREAAQPSAPRLGILDEMGDGSESVPSQNSKIRITVVLAGPFDTQERRTKPKAMILPPSWDLFLRAVCQKLEIGSVTRVETADGAVVEDVDEILHGDLLLVHSEDRLNGCTDMKLKDVFEANLAKRIEETKSKGSVKSSHHNGFLTGHRPEVEADDETEMQLQNKALELMWLLDDPDCEALEQEDDQCHASRQASCLPDSRRSSNQVTNQDFSSSLLPEGTPSRAGDAGDAVSSKTSRNAFPTHPSSSASAFVPVNSPKVQVPTPTSQSVNMQMLHLTQLIAQYTGQDQTGESGKRAAGEGAARFSPLIRVLHDHLTHSGQKEMERRFLAYSLQSTLPDWQTRLGVETLFDYIQEAAEVGLVSVNKVAGTRPPLYSVRLWGEDQCGVVKWVKESYGFIQSPAHHEDLFYHVSEVRVSRSLITGDMVDFLVVRNPITGKLNATQISLLAEDDDHVTSLLPLSVAVKRQATTTSSSGHLPVDDEPGLSDLDLQQLQQYSEFLSRGSVDMFAGTPAPAAPRHDSESETPPALNHEPWLYKTKLCKFWPHCPRGPKCWFAHGLVDLRKPTPIVPGVTSHPLAAYTPLTGESLNNVASMPRPPFPGLPMITLPGGGGGCISTLSPAAFASLLQPMCLTSDMMLKPDNRHRDPSPPHPKTPPTVSAPSSGVGGFGFNSNVSVFMGCEPSYTGSSALPPPPNLAGLWKLADSISSGRANNEGATSKERLASVPVSLSQPLQRSQRLFSQDIKAEAAASAASTFTPTAPAFVPKR